MVRKSAYIFSMLSIIFFAFSTITSASNYPSRNLQGIIMWGAGGACDNVSRAITPNVTPLLGKEIVLINKPGGTGAIATQHVLSSPSDGYTLLYGAENPQLHGILDLAKTDYKDFYPINVLVRGLGIIVVEKSAPWNTLKELIEDAQSRPGKLKMGSTGPGGIPYVVGKLLQSVTHIETMEVPFAGEGPGITALLGGHVDFMTTGLAAASEHIEAGSLKVLALVADEKLAGKEHYPLIIDDYPEFKQYLPWGPFYGVWVKRDVPDEIKQTLVDAFRKGAESERFKQFVSDSQTILMNLSGDEADAFLKQWQSLTTWLLHDAGATKVSPEDLGIPRP